MSSITVLTLVHNVREHLPRCLESVSWAEDIFCVVDARTTDGSDDIAKEYTNNVHYREFASFADQRNWGIEKISTEWTLVLDSDEWVSESLRDTVVAIVNDPRSKDFYSIRRQSYFFGKLIRHCGWDRDYNIRLFRTKEGAYEEKHVHEKVRVNVSVGKIDESMFHHAYGSFEEYFETFGKYTTLGAKDAFEQGRRAGVLDVTVRPLLRFLKMYFLRLGFLDGVHGAVLCGLGSFSVFTKYAKLWQLQLKSSTGAVVSGAEDE